MTSPPVRILGGSQASCIPLIRLIPDSYIFPFEPNPNWSSFYVGGPEIWQYVKETATKWQLEQFVQYNSRVTDSIWDDESGKWKVKIDRHGQIIADECDVLINASGILK